MRERAIFLGAVGVNSRSEKTTLNRSWRARRKTITILGKVGQWRVTSGKCEVSFFCAKGGQQHQVQHHNQGGGSRLHLCNIPQHMDAMCGCVGGRRPSPAERH